MYRHSLRLGRFGGISVRLHWSWLLMASFLLIALSQLYRTYAGGLDAVTFAALAVALLTLSVVLHELGHVLAARREGVPLRSVALFVFGGTTDLDEEALHPRAELLIALAGPAVSLALSALGAAAALAAGATLPGMVALQLAGANLLIALVNLLPGYPLDGGRVLRASLWFLLDDEIAATRATTRVGQICGWAVIAFGVVYGGISLQPLAGLLVVLVGYFVYRTAGVGYGQFVVQRTLTGVRVSDVMQPAFRAVAPDMRLDHFVGRYLLGQVDQGYPVIYRPDQEDPQPLLGMITVRNLRRYGLEAWAFTRVREAMTPADRVRILQPDMRAEEAFRLLMECDEEQLPVTDGAALLGVLRRRDLARFIQLRLDRAADRS